MVRIWAKVMDNDKILRDCIYENFEVLDYSKFHSYVRDICEMLDCPTPVVIKTHLFNYAKYNTVRFIKDDFVESIDFTKLVLENALL